MSEQDNPGGAEGLRLAEEIRLLVELVAEHAAPWLEGIVKAGHGMSEEDSAQGPEQHGEDTPGCGWCPLCAIVAVLRGERPALEVLFPAESASTQFVARLLEQAAQLVALLRAVLADRWEPEDGVHMPGFHPARREPEPAGAPASPRVQRITVRKRDNWQAEREY
ncbi:hypothetical protein ACFWY9_17305 [Amycolatopsis sp. NPDC059027]|uniref:hypothetical protein n=1 Tax=unclassified Amycolatopsis TaxID=2618356 RepID=UPI00366CA5BC